MLFLSIFGLIRLFWSIYIINNPSNCIKKFIFKFFCGAGFGWAYQKPESWRHTAIDHPLVGAKKSNWFSGFRCN